MEETSTNSLNTNNRIKVYPYRWVILIIFCLYAAINFLQFLQYTIITNIMTKYYDVDNFSMDMTGLVFMITFIVFCLPINHLIERYNLRVTALVGSGLTAVGNLLKLASVAPDRFYVAVISQTLIGIAQVFMLSIPSKLASTWFGPNEVSTACAIAILGTQFGVAIGCIIPPNLVHNSSDKDKIGDEIFQMMIYNAAVTVAIFLVVFILFKARPKLPPSQSQVTLVETERPNLIVTLKALFTNKDYIILLLVYAIANGMWTAVAVLINTIYLNYFPDSESDVGLISFISAIVGGCFGSLFFGYILDKTHKFKLVSFCAIIASALSLILVAVSLEEQAKLVTFFTMPLFAFFLASTLVIAFEFATELTYPLPEAISCSVLNAVIYLFAAIFTVIFEATLDSIGYIWTFTIMFILFLISAGLVFFISPNLHRRNANISQENQN